MGEGDEAEDTIQLGVTNWKSFRTSLEFEGVRATYTPQNGEWVLDSYEWVRQD